MNCCFEEIMNVLYEWKYEELNKGNRIKASMINKVQDRINERYIKYTIKKYKCYESLI